MLFALGLLASGLASSSVGAYAGGVIMEGLLKRKFSIILRRTLTLIPALVVLALDVNATHALVLSQVALSFGIPFALFPLVAITAKSQVMGKYANQRWVSALGYLIASVLTLLNLLLIILSF